jgi:hypothetical protein
MWIDDTRKGPIEITTMVKYRIVSSSSPEGLQNKVNELIEEGFTPTGGLNVNIIRQQNRYSGSQHMDTINSLEYVQSLVKNEKEIES